MAQAMIEERKRYIAEQALNVSTVKVQKNKRRGKEEKQSSAPEKKKPKLPKTTVGKAVKRKPKSSCEAALIPAKVSVVPSEEMKALFDSVTESPLTSSERRGLTKDGTSMNCAKLNAIALPWNEGSRRQYSGIGRSLSTRFALR